GPLEEGPGALEVEIDARRYGWHGQLASEARGRATPEAGVAEHVEAVVVTAEDQLAHRATQDGRPLAELPVQRVGLPAGLGVEQDAQQQVVCRGVRGGVGHPTIFAAPPGSRRAGGER